MSSRDLVGGEIVHDILNMTLISTVVHDCLSVIRCSPNQFHLCIVPSTSSNIGSGWVRLSRRGYGLLQLGEKLWCGALGCAVGEVEDYINQLSPLVVIIDEWRAYILRHSLLLPCHRYRFGLLLVPHTHRSDAWRVSILWSLCTLQLISAISRNAHNPRDAR